MGLTELTKQQKKKKKKKKIGNFHSGFHRNEIFDFQVPICIKYSSYIIHQTHITSLQEVNIRNINENENKFVTE